MQLIKHIFLTSSFLFLVAFGSDAQTTLKVVSKSVDKDFVFNAGKHVVVEGEKAEIKVETWDKNIVHVELKLVAKNPDKAIAESELKYFNHSFSEERGEIKLRNFFSASDKPGSELKAEYLIKVPHDCPVRMSNYFGKTDVKDLTSSLDIDSKFGPVNMNNITGKIDVKSRFGDVLGELLNGMVSIETHRSNITLKQLEGSYNIKSKYGIVKIFSDNELLDLNIEAEKSDVYFFNPNPTAFGYELFAHFGDITVPEELKVNFVENSDTQRHAQYSPGPKFPGVFVKITYGDIIVRKTRP